MALDPKLYPHRIESVEIDEKGQMVVITIYPASQQFTVPIPTKDFVEIETYKAHDGEIICIASQMLPLENFRRHEGKSCQAKKLAESINDFYQALHISACMVLSYLVVYFGHYSDTNLLKTIVAIVLGYIIFFFTNSVLRKKT